MKLNLSKFFKACNPSRTLVVSNPEDRKYYIDFAAVRGGKIIEALERTIARIAPDEPTCQLFAGHIGCGKSTELLRLKAELEAIGFHVVYFESSQDLDMADVDVTDILLAIARQVSESLEAIQIRLRPSYFMNLFAEIADFLQTPIDAQAELSFGIGKITAKTQGSPKLRQQLRQYLEPRTSSILQSLNQELLERARQELQRQGKAGLVVIVDNLDRVDARPTPSGRSQPEYLFIDRGEQLRKLNCHVVYTIPLSLIFSNESEALKQRLGGGIAPRILPMVPAKLRSGEDCPEGMALLKQMVMARAFPDENPIQRIDLISDVFDSVETLERLCRISGGHVRNLLGLLFGCLQQQEPPFARTTLEDVIRRERDDRARAITDDEWELIFQVVQQQSVRGDTEYQTLLRSMFVFEYQDTQGSWFTVNPVLAETKKFQSWLNTVPRQQL